MLKINTVTPFSKLLGNTEMCANSIFMFQMATVTHTVQSKVSVTEAVLKINIELRHVSVCLTILKMELLCLSLAGQYITTKRPSRS